MASVTTNKAQSLLIFISILQGTQSVFKEYKTVVNATVGQNISLPCILSKAHLKIIQLQWNKESEQGEQKLVVFNPAYSTLYYMNVTLELVKDTKTMELRGSILHLQEVTEKNSGDYVCDISSFPDGTIKTISKVHVTEPKVSMKITSPDRTVIEGDTVNITCVSDPPPDKYMLLSSLNQSIMESQDGRFTVQDVTRHISDLICQPLWSSSNQHLQNLKATVHLTVDFLDNLECTYESQIQVETGTNLTITCDAKSSTSLHFVWMKDNMTVSSSASISLWSVSPNHSGIYTLIVHTRNHNLHRQKEFTITVMNRTHTEDLSTTMTMETTPQLSSTTMATREPYTTMPTSQPHNTSRITDTTFTEEVTYISTSAPSTGNVTMVHANVTTPHTDVKSSATTFTNISSENRTLSEICCTSNAGSTSRETNYVYPSTSTDILTSASISNSTVRIKHVPTTKITRKGSTSRETTYVHPSTSTDIFTSASISNSTVRIKHVPTTSITRKDMSTTKSHVVFVIIPVLLVLLLIGFLYRQYMIQRRLDMPPPFKPPPPPVKYTSARHHDIPITDILV